MQNRVVVVNASVSFFSFSVAMQPYCMRPYERQWGHAHGMSILTEYSERKIDLVYPLFLMPTSLYYCNVLFDNFEVIILYRKLRV